MMKQKRHTLLIIEDNEINRDVLTEILSADYDILTAENGKVGLQCIQQNASEIDLILLDIIMPVMNGHEVLKALSDDSVLKQIPIIVTTSSDTEEEEMRCLELGAVDFIRKPCNPAIVRQRVKTIIRLCDSIQTLNKVEIDEVTGAYTRKAFFLHAENWIANSPDMVFSLSISDVKAFKSIHDMNTSTAFDLLRHQIELVRNLLGGKVLVGRFSLDQLVFLYPSKTQNMSQHEKEVYYEESVVKLSRKLNVTLKVGTCEQVDSSKSIRVHTDLALQALANVKSHYNRYTSFVGQELVDQMQRKTRIELLMEQALNNGELEVYYQPKHNSQGGSLIGAEALLRWKSTELGTLSPGEFIPIFEQTGFVVEADTFVWRETCRHLREWKEQGLQVVPVSVNASRLDFMTPNFDKRLISILAEYRIPAELLHLEVTESIFANLPHDAIELMNRFRDCGIQVELDDFGTGYSSLHALAELPIDIVKFDQSFVRKINAPREQLVMKGCVNLIKSLSLASVAEGVETEENQKLISELGIDAIQGFYFAKPMPAAEFQTYLKKKQSNCDF